MLKYYILHTGAVKLPPFWPDNIEMRFFQSESQFRLKGVTVSQTNFDYCVQSMLQEVGVKVLDLIRNPPTDNPYQHLKDRLPTPCFFLRAAFLKHLPSDVRAHLVHDRTLDPLTLALLADKIFQSRVTSVSAVNHVSSALVFGEEFPIHAVRPQASPHASCSSTLSPSSHLALLLTLSSAMPRISLLRPYTPN